MESVQAKQAELTARRAKGAPVTKQAALTEARMQNEVAQIAARAGDRGADAQAPGAAGGGRGGPRRRRSLMGVDEGVAMPSMIEQPLPWRRLSCRSARCTT